MGIWSDEQKQLVASMLIDKKTASQIGAVLGVTGNAIIGVVSRDKSLKAIGFARDNGFKKRAVTKPEPKRLPGRKGKKVASERFLYAKQAIHAAGLPLARLTARMCRFPVNDAERGQEHLFCGGEAKGDWCERHWAVVYYRPDK